MLNPQTETDKSSVFDWLDESWKIKPLNYVTEVLEPRAGWIHWAQANPDGIVWLTPESNRRIQSETLSVTDRDVLIKALLDPPEPTAELVVALRKHRMKAG